MTRRLIAAGVAVGVAFLLPDAAYAQAYCEAIRQAVAIYGYEASRRHALEHYGEEAVKAGDRCLAPGRPTKRDRSKRAADEEINYTHGSRR
jgi:hypothetical protein